MFFQNNIIWSEFPEIWLYHNHEIDKKDQQNLIQDDETTTNPDDIDGVQTNNNAEFKAREGEDLEEQDSRMMTQSFPPIQKLQILTYFQPKIQEVEGHFESHIISATQTFRQIWQQLLTTTIIKS